MFNINTASSGVKKAIAIAKLHKIDCWKPFGDGVIVSGPRKVEVEIGRGEIEQAERKTWKEIRRG